MSTDGGESGWAGGLPILPAAALFVLALSSLWALGLLPTGGGVGKGFRGKAAGGVTVADIPSARKWTRVSSSFCLFINDLPPRPDKRSTIESFLTPPIPSHIFLFVAERCPRHGCGHHSVARRKLPGETH